MNATSIVAVSEVPAHLQAGAITYWSLRGDTSRAALSAAWDAAFLDMDMLPAAPSADASLRYAMKRVTQLSTERVLLRPLKTRGAWALVGETVAGSTPETARLRHYTRLKAWLDPQGAIIVERPQDQQEPLAGEATAEWFDITADGIYSAFAHHQDCMTSGELGNWLIRLATGYASAVSLRKMGGMYFVPPSSMGLWDEVVEIVREIAGESAVHRIPALRTADVVAAVTEAVLADAGSTIEALREDAAQATLGSRGLRTRRAQAEALRDKLAAYSGLLGAALKGVGERLEMASAEISVALLQADIAEKAVRA